MKTTPPFRKLRGFAFDPALSQQADTADISTIVYKVAWEDLSADMQEIDVKKRQGPGPKGEYLEIISYDPSLEKYYVPVDLNDAYILAEDGLQPSESNPQFHQQMVYAVVMTTIKNFERALGRKVLWAPQQIGNNPDLKYVQHLRIYPHALREANAYYSPQKKSLLFGYFTATPADNCLQMPRSLVFTCLSHDIIAHEATHAILDGMHRHYNIATNPDVLAFHEAFSDIVALFQHFSFPEVLKNQIAETRGDLASQNLLGKLAQQFGVAIGNYGSLRDAIGTINEEGVWEPKKPASDEYTSVMEPHARGSILVAAIFEAFINIYKNQVADLLRIASNGSGILQQGSLHPDLINRLANEASKIAGRVLQMCIRALDYCPPVDVTFGDYLRAIITADIDLVAEDSHNYRLYFIDAFRKRGIYPQGIQSLSQESLSYKKTIDMNGPFSVVAEFLRQYKQEIMYEGKREKIYEITKKYMGGDENLSLHKRFTIKFNENQNFEKLTGLVFGSDWRKLGIRTSDAYEGKALGPSFQVQNLRLISRVSPDGTQINQIIFSIIQRAGVFTNEEGKFSGTYERGVDNAPSTTEMLKSELWGGCTFIFDLDSLTLKYIIPKPLLDIELLKKGRREIDSRRVENFIAYQSDISYLSDYNNYFGIGPISHGNEPFCFLHQH